MCVCDAVACSKLSLQCPVSFLKLVSKKLKVYDTLLLSNVHETYSVLVNNAVS